MDKYDFPSQKQVADIVNAHPGLREALLNDEQNKAEILSAVSAFKLMITETDDIILPKTVDDMLMEKLNFSNIQTSFNLTDDEVHILSRQAVKEALLMMTKIATTQLVEEMSKDAIKPKCGCTNCKCEKSDTFVDKNGKIV